MTVIAQDIALVPARIGGDADELDLLPHWRLIDQPLDFRDPLGMQRTFIRTIRVDEMQHHDFAAEVGETDIMSVRILQRESGRVLRSAENIFRGR